MRLDVLWHDLECSAYDQDLPLWRALAAETGGVVLDVGAGTGRVSLDLCRWRRAVVALDTDASLLAALERRGAGLPIETVVADAVTLLCLGGSRSCSSRCRPSSYSGAVPAVRLSALRAGASRAGWAARRPNGGRDGLLRRGARPAAAGVRYASHLLSVVEEDGRAAIHRRCEIVGPGERHESIQAVVRLDRVTPREITSEAAELGYLAEPARYVHETEEYLGSTVVVLRAPTATR